MSLKPVAAVVSAALASVILAACGDGSEKSVETPSKGLTAVIASADLAVGQQRLTFVVLDDDVPVVDKPVHVRFFKDLDNAQPTVVGDGDIPWVALGAKEEGHSGSGHSETELTGIYYVNIKFDTPGTWGIGISVGEKLDLAREMRLQFVVKEKSTALNVGERAVAVQNPTIRDRTLKQIHTGADVDPAFHTLNIADAISSGKPSVIVFATPSFCRTRTCGPALQVAIKAADKFGAKANFVHVEPYQLDADGNMTKDSQGNQFQVVEAGEAWRLPTEPWVFVVDKSGTIMARFDGPYALEELEYVLGQLAATGG